MLQRIQNSKERFGRRLEAAAKSDDVFYLPLAEEGIEYARRDGSQNSKTTLGAQMKMFQKKVAAEEKELESLWKQWDQVQDELKAVVEEALGVNWATVVADLPAGTLGEAVSNVLNGETVEAFNKVSKRFEDLLNTTSEHALEKMMASEKVGS